MELSHVRYCFQGAPSGYPKATYYPNMTFFSNGQTVATVSRNVWIRGLPKHSEAVAKHCVRLAEKSCQNRKKLGYAIGREMHIDYEE